MYTKRSCRRSRSRSRCACSDRERQGGGHGPRRQSQRADRAVPGANPVELILERDDQLAPGRRGHRGDDAICQGDGGALTHRPVPREIRMIELKLAKAKEVVTFLEELLRRASRCRSRAAQDPVFEAIDTTDFRACRGPAGTVLGDRGRPSDLDDPKTSRAPPSGVRVKLRTRRMRRAWRRSSRRRTTSEHRR